MSITSLRPPGSQSFTLHVVLFISSLFLKSSASLLVLSSHLIPERIPRSSSVLVLKVLVNRRSSQTTQSLAITAVRQGRIVVLITEVVVGVVQLNAASILVRSEDVVTTSLAATITVSRAAHDVAELDAAGLAVPQEEADDDEDDAAEGDGQGDGQGFALGDLGLWVLGQAGGRKGHGQGDGGVLVVCAAGGGEEGDCDVVELLALEHVGLDLEGPEAPGGGHALVVEGLELDPFIAGAVEVVQADGDFVGGV